jgi:L-malate glycosyltransferase
MRELARIFAPRTEPGDGGFVTVARFVTEKNLGILLDAYAGYRKKAKNPRSLALYGGGPLEADLRAHAKALGIGGHVQFFPFLQRDEIALAMAKCVGLILPSVLEPFGNVVIEAQAVGIPVFVSDRCGSAELVEDLINGYTFAPDCPEALSNFMVELLERPGLWGQMAANSYATAITCDVDRLVEAVRYHARVEA